MKPVPRLPRGLPDRNYCWASLLALALACVDGPTDSVRWPAQEPGLPAQPIQASARTGVTLRASALVWEPQGVVVELEIQNDGEGLLSVEREAIFVAYASLEFAVQASARADAPEPAVLEVGPGETVRTRLRYHLGRALTGPGARLILRSSARDGVAIVELPELDLPAMPAR